MCVITFMGTHFLTLPLFVFSSFPVCRLKVIRGRWFTYICVIWLSTSSVFILLWSLVRVLYVPLRLLCLLGSVCFLVTGWTVVFVVLFRWTLVCRLDPLQLRYLFRSSERVVFEVLYCVRKVFVFVFVPCGVFGSAGGELISIARFYRKANFSTTMCLCVI